MKRVNPVKRVNTGHPVRPTKRANPVNRVRLVNRVKPVNRLHHANCVNPVNPGSLLNLSSSGTPERGGTSCASGTTAPFE